MYTDAEVKDLEDQQSGNYQYDKIGNLIKDVKEGITAIEWTVYGKIRRFIKNDSLVMQYSYDISINTIQKK